MALHPAVHGGEFEPEKMVSCADADFLRFGVWGAQEIFKEQPSSVDGIWNRQDYRPLDGFICAISPFNFTSIGGNLPTAPAIVGNVALWKPSRTAALSNYYYMKLLQWCGLPAGVINFVPCSGSDMSRYVVSHPKMAGFHFTGSTAVFQSVWKQVGENIASYANYPRLVGETGGKDFIFAHPTADIEPLAAAIIRGSFEFQGQKCSACSRAFIPESIWPAVEKLLKEHAAGLKVGGRVGAGYLHGRGHRQGLLRDLQGLHRPRRRLSRVRVRGRRNL